MVAAVRSPSPQLMRTAEAAHCPGMAEVLTVSTLWYSVNITMNIELKSNIHGLTAVAAALASLIGCEIGLDWVR